MMRNPFLPWQCYIPSASDIECRRIPASKRLTQPELDGIQ